MRRSGACYKGDERRRKTANNGIQKELILPHPEAVCRIRNNDIICYESW